LIGAAVGNYRIVDVLGEGGMGTVYRAVHPELERTVAIKVLALGLSGSHDIVRRFRVEAKAVNRIRHPNIVDVQDFGTLPDGRPYYVMEYMAGESLGHYLTRVGALPARDTLVITLPIAEALEAAHNAGVVHRDLKPDNIFLLARDGKSPTPKLLDFGIAKVLSETIAGGTGRTQAGALMGTPLYMSPEQAGGRVEELGTPSDVYSLGVILYQMLSGKPPFEAPGFGELLMMHMQTPPPPLSSRVGGVPPNLEELVMRTLSKSPAARPPNAGALRKELLAIAASLDVSGSAQLERSPFAPTMMAGAGPLTPPPGTLASMSAAAGEVAPRARTLRSRGKGLAIAAAATVVVAAIAIVVAATRGGSESAAPAAAVPLDAAAIAAPADAAVRTSPPIDAALPDAAVDAAIDAALPQSELERRLGTLKRACDDHLYDEKECARRRKEILGEYYK
jgi:serine/threonine-protein kinase